MSDHDKPAPEVKKRRPYVPPVLESEETFERDAVLGCGKISAPAGPCHATPRSS